MSAPLTGDDPTGAVPRVRILHVLSKPQVARTLAASIVARLPFGAMGLLTVLRLTEGGYGYGAASVAAAAYALALALVSPLLSRIVDRDGQTRILLLTGFSGAAATAAIGVLPTSSPLWLFVVVAGLNGALQPPLGGAMRALWEVLLTREDERHVGYAVEAGAVEMVFTGGPLLIVGGVAGIFGASAGLLVAAALTGFGTLAFAMAEPSRRWTPSPLREPNLMGALRSPGVWTLMIVAAGAGGSFGALEIAVTAFGREEGSTALIGVLLAIWSVGSLVGGLVIARMRPAAVPARRIVGTLLLMATGNVVLGVAGSPWALAALLFVAGGAIAPTFATANAVMGSVAPPGMITEAFAFTMAAVMVGLTIGSPVSGFLIDHVSVGAALSASGLSPALAAIVVWLRRGTVKLPVVSGEVAHAEAQDSTRPGATVGPSST